MVRRQRGRRGDAIEGDRVAAPTPAVELRSIRKTFGDVTAIDDATFEAARGEIHALLGENGAGKTSLMNVLAGVYRPEAGEIRIDGQPVAIRSPDDAKLRGVGMVHQELRLVGRFTAPENVAVGSSRIRMRAPWWSSLTISTRWRRPRGMLQTGLWASTWSW